MNLDLGGQGFGNNGVGYAGQNAASVMDTSSRAVLYIFRPHHGQFGDVGLRPFQYRFDENFLNEVAQVTDMSRQGRVPSSSLVSDMMSQTNFNEYMTASMTPTLVMNASKLSDRYRFILILSEKPRDLISSFTAVSSGDNGSQVRRIYTGFFEDEPFNPQTLSSHQRTLNPNAFMVITHKTIVGTATTHGAWGSRSSVNTQSSEEILNSDVANALIGHNHNSGSHGVFLMTPANCVNSIETSEEGYSMSVPGLSDITKDHGTQVVHDILEQPAQNVSQIIKGMIRFQDEATARSRLSTHRAEAAFDDSFLDEGMGRMRLSRHMDLQRSHKSSPFDLEVDRRISPIDLNNLVSGDLDVIDFDLERPQYYETADQMEQSVTHQYSSLISSVIAPVLNSAGINALQFEFQIARMRGEVVHDFRVHSAEPVWTVPNPDLLQMVKAVETELKYGIFMTIFQTMGDFHVAVSANTTGMTVVRLSLVGQGYRNSVDFEIPTCLGGLVSPLIGDLGSNTHNSEMVEQLYGIATGVGSIVNNFNDDDRQYMKDAQDTLWSHQHRPPTLDLSFNNDTGFAVHK